MKRLSIGSGALILALTTGAYAQPSSVTLYGVVDVSLGKAKNGQFGFNNGRGSTTANTSYQTPTRFGFRGVEDLGNGLKANFNFESGSMLIGTGGVSGDLFNREAWVGLSGTQWGSTRAGRTSSVAFQGHVKYDLNGLAASSAADNAGISPLTWYGAARRSAQIQYNTPKFGDIDASIGYVAAGNNGGLSSTQLRIGYGQAPFRIDYVTESKRAANNRTAWALAGSTKLSDVTLQAGYSVTETVAKGKGWHMGASIPYGAWTVGIQHAHNTVTDINATELFVRYDLSKRTAVYLDIMDKTRGGAYAVGLVHRF